MLAKFLIQLLSEMPEHQIITMNPFQFITRIFIDVFGITHPTEREERRAAWFICSLLGLVAATMVLIFFLVFRYAHH